MKQLTILLLFISITSFGQKYITKTGQTDFEASVKAFEPVEATNNSTTAIINIETGEVAALLFIAAFDFKVALMQEHFNENYMSSDKYPKATFKGKITNFDVNEVSDIPKDFDLKGTLTIKGIPKEIQAIATLSFKKDSLIVKTAFDVAPSNFDIKIPSIVEEKISENIHISINYALKKK
ncbi:YceI family protein [Flammeovirga kamogawensis]|uniref:YceI family protein n=1 Tax=Flammeovirga kamogawensis TaxID=373891 RepID=A0ABX8H1F4_9BACT|nr:YceI family protein [Flammeovirga kamogawensis]MBB6462594.1 polyisoprenoid-binding protein YceI [Flammeovirga kamogawensis]QWG09660.1 YceI family protein [Flammeovirga kamogawensis]TRX65174.1 YceI family protein [Flammeovirga kamogawensis]